MESQSGGVNHTSMFYFCFSDQVPSAFHSEPAKIFFIVRKKGKRETGRGSGGERSHMCV